MSQRQALNPTGMAFPGMNQGVRFGDTIHISGQVALREGKLIGIGNAEAQARQCFANIEAVLALGGAELADVGRCDAISSTPSITQPTPQSRMRFSRRTRPAGPRSSSKGSCCPSC